MRLAGHVFDTYDDIDGKVLREIFPSIDVVPEFVKAAHRLTPEEAGQLPDDRFALVLLDNGLKHRKYAMVDAGNVELSANYLLKQAHLLPEEAVKSAAQQLLSAYEHYKLTPSFELKIAAMTGSSGVSGKQQFKPYAQGAKVIKVQADGGMRHATHKAVEKPMLGQVDPADSNLQQRTNYQGVPGTNFVELPIISPKEKQLPGPVSLAKQASGIGNDLASRLAQLSSSAASQARRADMTKATPEHFQEGNGTVTRMQHHEERSYFDLTGWDPAMAVKEASLQPTRTLLDGHYPVDTYEQTEKAAHYFSDYWKQFQPAQRREYCVKLAARMAELSIPVPELVDRYSAPGYALDTDQLLEQRRQYVKEDFHPVLDVLLEKRACVEPQNFVNALTVFDTQTGLNYFWGSMVMDPYFTTYGPSMQKVAEESWSYDDNGTRVSLEDLKYLALNGKSAVIKQFGKAFSESFSKDPKGIFESLPKPNKLVLARLATDRHSGTNTE